MKEKCRINTDEGYMTAQLNGPPPSVDCSDATDLHTNKATVPSTSTSSSSSPLWTTYSFPKRTLYTIYEEDEHQELRRHGFRQQTSDDSEGDQLGESYI